MNTNYFMQVNNYFDNRYVSNKIVHLNQIDLFPIGHKFYLKHNFLTNLMIVHSSYSKSKLICSFYKKILLEI